MPSVYDTCVVCGCDLTKDEYATMITNNQFGTIAFCDKCWSQIWQVVYDDIAGSGRITEKDSENE